MSLETQLAELTAAVNNLTAAILGTGSDGQEASQPTKRGRKPAAPATTTVAQVPAAEVKQIAQPIPAPPTNAVPFTPPSAPAMPPAPTFLATAPAAAPAAPANVPFSDSQGCMSFVIALYTELGPEKGAALNSLLHKYGASNPLEVKIEQYPSFYADCVALKG